MSDLLGPLLGMSPWGFGVAAQQSDQANDVRLAAQAVRPFNVTSALNTMAPLLPVPGIHWTRTGGKSWRVVIVR